MLIHDSVNLVHSFTPFKYMSPVHIAPTGGFSIEISFLIRMKTYTHSQTVSLWIRLDIPSIARNLKKVYCAFNVVERALWLDLCTLNHCKGIPKGTKGNHTTSATINVTVYFLFSPSQRV